MINMSILTELAMSLFLYTEHKKISYPLRFIMIVVWKHNIIHNKKNISKFTYVY